MKSRNSLFRSGAILIIALCSCSLAFAQTHISDRAGLENIKNNLSGSYILDEDIDLSGVNWTPLGDFTGTLDGNGHVISNMTIEIVKNGTAFFTRIKGDAVVKNLGFENASVTNKTESRTAILTGFLEGNAVIENCYIANSTILGRWCVGSFAGRAMNITDGGTAAIRNCYSSATIYHASENDEGRGMTGGIIGSIYDGNKMVVENCYFSGTIQKVYRATEKNGEGNIAGIVGWIGQDGTQTLSGYALQNNVNLAPYILSNHGKHRISSTRSDEVAVNNPTPGPNYSLSTTVLSTADDWGNTSAIIPTDGAQYGAAKKDGENIPDGDANAKAQNFYETTLGWSFGETGIWAINNSYPYFQWADQTRPHWVVTPAASALSLTSDAPIDLSKYIFSGRGLPLTFTTESAKITINGSTVSFAQAVSAVETVTVQVQEGNLTPTYSLSIALVPDYIAIATPADLEQIRTLASGKYVLTADLDMSGIDFTPIDNFTGTLDGDGHVISNLTPVMQEGSALFKRIQGNAVVKNLGFENANVDGGWNVRIAVVAGYMDGNSTIENCYIANSTVKGRWHVGSFVGRMDNNGTKTIRNCYSSAYLYTPEGTQAVDTENTGHIAGIVGVLNGSNCKVENCYFSGIIQRNPSLQVPNEGQTAGIAAWNNNSANIITNNVNLSPYLLSNTGKYRISSVQGNPAPGANEPSGPNYSLSTTVVSTADGWGNTNDIIATDNEWYGAAKRHGENIPGGDANARTQDFYANTLEWDFTGVWTMSAGGYPVFAWEKDTTHFVVVPDQAFSLTSDAQVDLSRYIFSGRGLPLSFTTASDKISVNNGIVSVPRMITAEETVVVSVREGTLEPAYPIEIILIPAFNITIGTFTGGTVTADKESCEAGQTVTLTITPAAGYEFESISVYKAGDPETTVALTGEGAERTFTMPAYGITVTAAFTAIVYNIAGPADLEQIRTLPTGKYVLTADLDMSGIDFTPIDNFTGTLDGDGHVISNLTINRPSDSERTAFFKNIKNGAVIKNLGFENARIVGNAQAAVLTGHTEGNNTIENCYIANSSITGRWCVGSFIGRAEGTTTVRNSYSSAYIVNPANTDNSGHTGGIIGDLRSSTSTVENCYFSGIIQRYPTTYTGGSGAAEGQVAGIVAWNENATNAISRNVNLAPYLLSENGKYRISSVQTDGAGNEPTGPNYSLSTTVVSGSDGWGNTSDSIATDNVQYGINKKHGANIPGGDANAKALSFYETTLEWDFTDVWTMSDGGYPVFAWEKDTTHFVVVPQAISLTSETPVDLSEYIFSGRGLSLTFSTESDKIAIHDGIVSIVQAVPEEETVIVSVKEGTLTETYSLEITLAPSYNVSIGTFTGGTVTSDKAFSEAGKTVTLTIAPAAGHELKAISAYKTGDPETPVTLAGEDNERTFVMPAYGVTVIATFGYPTGIRAANASPVIVSVREGELQASFEGSASVKLYSVTGVLLDETTANSVYTYSVKQGIYILSVAGKAYKVIVK